MRPRRVPLLKAIAFVASAVFAGASAVAQEPPANVGDGTDTPEPTILSDEETISQAVSFAERLTADATSALTKNGAAETERLAEFQSVLNEGLALDVIGKFMLGQSRKSMTDEQRARYEAVFPDYITRQYAEQFQDIVGRPLEVVDAKRLGKKDVLVRTRFNRDDGDPINVDWRIRRLKSGEQKAIDIIVSGVSIMLVKREEFSAYIAQNSVDDLLNRLEDEISA